MRMLYPTRLRELREERDIKQLDVALFLGTTQQVYSRYENGVNELPLHHLVKICRFFQVSADHILGPDLLAADEEDGEGSAEPTQKHQRGTEAAKA